MTSRVPSSIGLPCSATTTRPRVKSRRPARAAAALRWPRSRSAVARTRLRHRRAVSRRSSASRRLSSRATIRSRKARSRRSSRPAWPSAAAAALPPDFLRTDATTIQPSTPQGLPVRQRQRQATGDEPGARIVTYRIVEGRQVRVTVVQFDSTGAAARDCTVRSTSRPASRTTRCRRCSTARRSRKRSPTAATSDHHHDDAVHPDSWGGAPLRSSRPGYRVRASRSPASPRSTPRACAAAAARAGDLFRRER